MANYYDREDEYRERDRSMRGSGRDRYRGERYGDDYERDRGWELRRDQPDRFGSGWPEESDRGYRSRFFTGDQHYGSSSGRRDFGESFRSRYDRDWSETPTSERGRSYGSAGFGDSRERESERGYGGTFRPPDYGRDFETTTQRTYREGSSLGKRDFLDRATDEVQSWFGDEGAERRRQFDKMRKGDFRGRGPKGYRRSDERIREDINDRLTEHAHLDASDIEVSVKDCEVTLTGKVFDRTDKRLAEDVAEDVPGVKNVQNNLRTDKSWDTDTTARPASSTARAA